MVERSNHLPLPPLWEVGDRVDLMLTYEGPLPSRTARSALTVKNQIRRAISPQIQTFIAESRKFQYLLGPHPTDVRVGGVQFVPLVIRGLIAHLRIEVLRRENPGNIFQGGDIDGRLKTLLDGLRMPHHEDEMHGYVIQVFGLTLPEERIYCLLEDDSLVSEVHIIARRLLRPARLQEGASDVDVRVHVELEAAPA